MKVPLYNQGGKSTKKVDLPDEIFVVPVQKAVMYQAFVRQMANARLGTHKTKTRAEVADSGAKAWRQKGTGRARQGSRSAPHWKGGGVVFGPTPDRNYEQEMPRKMRHLALKGALTAKAQEGKILVLEELKLKEAKTKEMQKLLKNLKVETSALILLPKKEEGAERAARNLPGVKTILAQYLNLRDLLAYDWLVIPQESLAAIEGILAE